MYVSAANACTLMHDVGDRVFITEVNGRIVIQLLVDDGLKYIPSRNLEFYFFN